MHRLACLVALACACTRENPGFVVDSDDPGASEPATTSTSATTTAVATSEAPTTEAPTTAAPTTDVTTGDDPLPACHLYPNDVGLMLDATIDDDPIANDPMNCAPQTYRGIGFVTAFGLTVNLDNCIADPPPAQTLHVSTGFDNQLPVELPGDCFTVTLAWQPDCVTLRSVVVKLEPFNIPIPVVLAVGVSASTMPVAGLDGLIAPTLEPIDGGVCQCDDACLLCAESRPPGDYQLRFDDVASTVLGPGDLNMTAEFPAYKFFIQNLRSHIHPECGAGRLHLDWYAIVTA
ncbi:hypothetical protein [Nannocystis sp.]|uniref:hypothetical protein n=1 Tax=Nannocystis sp. TaxID=1962667 RepID=UPI0025FD6D88|nr:hypothetical protein [Nannocystis sp.]MBK7829934.1 hypothetical protein [Nannocystis sp.]